MKEQVIVVGLGRFGSAVAREIEALDHEVLADFDHDQLHDYRSRRPAMAFDTNQWKSYADLHLRLYRVTDEQGEVFLLLTGPEGAVHLTGGEAQLLSALARRPGETLSREEISEALRMDDAGERAIDVQVTRLRRKIERDPREPRFLQTVRGRGYALYPGP